MVLAPSRMGARRSGGLLLEKVGRHVRIVLSANVSDSMIGREYIDDEPEGEFVAMADGPIASRHPVMGRCGPLAASAL